ncbi:aspartate/glutamate racemase family protein [Halomonas koreensis]|uniref:Aspartate/glutamate racemase family protein n=1 Tax=Halomonas koreensis TaxID=245385 RepID=A0ABU1G3K3_9GAMM|nr:aspartate/glutamate racemase family protein [Halomonas koreensis]MDR5867517.1 aspartate/glutamate racemase family protein [Halomonas koreensis]
MKTIGVLGGMSWESTERYYRALNEGVKAARGGLHSAKVALYSVDFAEIETLQRESRWDEAGERLAEAARRVQAAGADFLLLATNTMHRVAPAIEAAVEIPLLHIADATGERLREDGVRRVGLLGTRFTMEQAFYTDRLTARFGIEALVPEAEARERVHRVIFEELCRGHVEPASKAEYLEIIADLHARGAEAVILGCTEIALLVGQADTPVPLYDTTSLHAAEAVAMALNT